MVPVSSMYLNGIGPCEYFVNEYERYQDKAGRKLVHKYLTELDDDHIHMHIHFEIKSWMDPDSFFITSDNLVPTKKTINLFDEVIDTLKDLGQIPESFNFRFDDSVGSGNYYRDKDILGKSGTHLKEIGTVCGKDDGWDMIIEVHSDDHGILFDNNNPAYAHIRDLNGRYLGKFAITKEKPRSLDNVFDCDKNHIIPSEFKRKIVDWAQEPSAKYDEEDGIATNWGAVKAEWRNLHPGSQIEQTII